MPNIRTSAPPVCGGHVTTSVPQHHPVLLVCSETPSPGKGFPGPLSRNDSARVGIEGSAEEEASVEGHPFAHHPIGAVHSGENPGTEP